MLTSDTAFQEVADRLKKLEKNFIELKIEIKVKLKNLQYVEEIRDQSMEQNKKKKGISGYSVEGIVIILLAISIVVFKLIFK